MDQHRMRAAALALVLLALFPATALAHRDDYLNETSVYLTLERSELELEYWFDAGSLAGGHDFVRHNVATELGITDRWMVDARVTYLVPEGRRTRFDSWRLETRYRFSDEGVWPVDVAASMELNSEREREGAGDVGLEPRLVLSKDVTERLNLTVNLEGEIPLEESEPASFLPAFGVRLNWGELVRIGSELQYDCRRHAGTAIPQVWFAFTPELILKLGYAARFDRETESYGRAALEVEF